MPDARRRSEFIDAVIDEYAAAHSTPPDAHQLELQRITREKTGRAAGMQIGDDQAVLMEMLVRAMGATRAVEIGTFTGYSALAVARGMGPGGRLLCCDISQEWTSIARAAWQEAGVADRVTAEGQSFFDPLPAGDLYVLKSVLNDWPDEPTVAILRRCAEAARPDGRIAVLGGVAADDAPRPLGIDMLVAGGKTSTLTQFTELARRSGLDILAAGPQSSGRYVVECRPANGKDES